MVGCPCTGTDLFYFVLSTTRRGPQTAAIRVRLVRPRAIAEATLSEETLMHLERSGWHTKAPVAALSRAQE